MGAKTAAQQLSSKRPAPASAKPVASTTTRSLLPTAGVQQEIGNAATMRRLFRSTPIQPKLTVSKLEDESEQEADRVDDQVMRMPEPTLTTAHSSLPIHRACDSCEEELQRKPEFAKDEIVDDEDVGILQAKLESSPGPETTQINPSGEHYGNELQRKAAPATETAGSRSTLRGPGSATETSNDRESSRFGNSILRRLFAGSSVPLVESSRPSPTVQPKVTVSDPKDESELEADRVADQVMRMPEPQSGLAVQRVPLKIQRKCTECEDELQRKADSGKDRKLDEEEGVVHAKLESSPFSDTSIQLSRSCEKCDDKLQRQIEDEEPTEHSPIRRLEDRGSSNHTLQAERNDGSAATAHLNPSSSVSLRALEGGGRPLPARTRAFFEPRFGADFSDVRLHTGPAAEQTAKSINARAFTVRRDIAFGAAQYSPESHEGLRLLAHELSHVIQQDSVNGSLNRVQRAPLPGDSPPRSPATADKSPDETDKSVTKANKAKAPKTGATVSIAGIELSENPEQVKEVMEDLVVTGIPKIHLAPGIYAPHTFIKMLPLLVTTEPGVVGYVSEEQLQVLRTKIKPLLRPAATQVFTHSLKIIADFEKVMKDNALKTLAASKIRAEAERVRYGITTKKGSKSFLFGAYPIPTTTHSIADPNSPTLKLMREGAKLLLARRQAIRAKALEADKHFGCVMGNCGGDREYPRLSKELLQMRQDYQKIHQQIAFQFPILDRLGALEADPGPFETTDYKFKELQRIASGDSESERAATIGDQIEDTLAKNEKTRQGVENKKVNLWRLQNIFGLAKAQSEVDADPFRKKLIEERWKDEQPKMIDAVLEGIAMLVLNIAAIVLAAPTGGASLAVAFGVNAALAAKHTMDYLLDKAVAGSDIVRAQSLSQDDPSFLWLAIEIIGVGLDGAAAVSAMKALRPVVKAAEIASNEGKLGSVVKSMEDAAKPFEKPGLVKRILDKLPKARTAALESAGGTKAEIGQWAKATRAFEAEAADTLAPAVRSTVGTEVKISRAGHIFTCSSPCQVIRDKYAELLAAGTKIKGEAATLEQQLVAFEKRALKAAGDTKLAKSADEVATAKKAAEALEKEIALFEQKVAKEAAYLGAMKTINGLDPAVAAKIAQLEKDAIIKIGTLDAAAIENLSKLEINALQKLIGLPEETLKGLAKLETASLKALGEMDPVALSKLRNAKNIDPTTKVGSSAAWKGTGSPPKWSTPKAKAYTHVRRFHSADRRKTPEKVWHRMETENQPQGIWRNDNLIVEAEKITPPFEGKYIIDMGKDVGDVFEMDRTITKGVTKFLIIRDEFGELVSAYPISASFTGW